ncbi:MAG: DUF6384 family protein [Planctomycetota bacterium]
MASQQQQAPPEQSTTQPTAVDRRAGSEDLTIAEMTRIMDVAQALRRERTIAARELSQNETKRMLRQQLIETARVTGDPVTEAEIDAAIEHYFDTLHEFEPPEASLETFLAYLYVMRGEILAWTAFLGGGAAVLWTLFGVMPAGLRARGLPRMGWRRW